MRRTPKRMTFVGLKSRAYRCRLEQLEARSMMAADVVAATVDFALDEMPVTDQFDELPVDAWPVCDLPPCDLQANEIVDPMPGVDPVIIDDSCLMVDDSSPMVYEPIDVRVQFVSSETEPGWATYSYTVGTDGVVQGVSVVASYDEPTVADFVAEHADDPGVQISDYGDGWWIDGFPLELAPPVPEYGVFYGGFCGGGLMASDESGGIDAVGDWSWDGSGEVSYCGWSSDGGTDAGGDPTASWDESGMPYSGDWSWNAWNGGDFAVTPLFYARGAELSESFTADFAAYSIPAAADPANAVRELDVAVAEPVVVSPRSAAFADMSTMAAAAMAARANAADAMPFGGGRRRR